LQRVFEVASRKARTYTVVTM